MSAAFTVAISSLLVALAMAARELIVAARFGTGAEADAIVVAILLPTFAINVIGGSVGSSLVPAVIAAREQSGENAAEQLIAGIGALVLSALAVATLIMALAAPLLLSAIGSGFDSEKLELTRNLYFVSLPSIVLGGICSVWSTALNASGRFALAASSPAVVPLAPVIGLLLFPHQGVYAIAIGLVVGYATRAAILFRGLAREGVRARPRWFGWNSHLIEWRSQYVPTVVAAVFMATSVIIDQSVAASLGAGSVATLAFGTRLVLLFTGLGAAALGTAVLPFFSSMSASHSWRQLRSTLWFFVGVGLFCALPAAIVLIAFSEVAVRLVFQRGSFGPADTIAVAQVQALAAIQLPFFAAGMVFSRMVSALGANQLLLRQSLMVLVLTATLDLTLARSMGVAGIALATSIVAVFSMVYLLVCSLKLLSARERRS